MLHRFNNYGYPTEVADALGQKTVFERRPFNNELLSATDHLGRKTSFTYDDKGNVTSITDPQGNITRFEYEPNFSRLTKITDDLGNIISFTYDANGNLTSELKTQNSELITYTWNACNQLTSMTGASFV